MVDNTREARYGEVIWNTSRADEGTISATGANIVARVVMAVADEEQAELRAEVEHLRADKATYTKWVDRWVADMELMETRVARAEDEADAAESKLRDMEAVIVEKGKLHSTWDKRSEMVVPVDDLRAVLKGTAK